MTIKKKILFLGASITQGRISVSYVNMLKKRAGMKVYKFINHGVAGYESYNVLGKLDKAIHTKPDFVILLVGTNDVMSSLNPELARLSRKLKHIPHEPTLLNYGENITHIIKTLKQKTRSEVALVSLPVIGENLESIENKTVHEYNDALKKIAETENVEYLPVHERQQKFLEEHMGGKGKDCINSTKLAFAALFRHYFLFERLDAISRKNGFVLLTDGLHQNSLGAAFIADEIENFIKHRQSN